MILQRIEKARNIIHIKLTHPDILKAGPLQHSRWIRKLPRPVVTATANDLRKSHPGQCLNQTVWRYIGHVHNLMYVPWWPKYWDSFTVWFSPLKDLLGYLIGGYDTRFISHATSWMLNLSVVLHPKTIRSNLRYEPINTRDNNPEILTEYWKFTG